MMPSPPPPLLARARLVALGISQCAHLGCTYALRVHVALLLATYGGAERESAWHLVTALFMLPAIVLVPIIGAVGNSLPRWRVLVSAAAFVLAILVVPVFTHSGWLVGLAMVAVGAAVYSPVRLALLAAAAHETRWTFARVVGGMEVAAVLSIVSGMIAGGALSAWHWEESPLQPAPALILALAGLSLLFAWGAQFPTDVSRAEPAWPAFLGFFRDLRRCLQGTCGAALGGMAYLRGLTTVAGGAFIANALTQSEGETARALGPLMTIAITSLIGAALGSFLATLLTQTLGRRTLILLGSVGWLITLLVVAYQLPHVSSTGCLLVGLFGGLVNVPLLAAYQHAVPADARGNGMALLNTAGTMAMTLFSLILAFLARSGILTATGQVWFVLGLGVPGILLALLSSGIDVLATRRRNTPAMPRVPQNFHKSDDY